MIITNLVIYILKKKKKIKNLVPSYFNDGFIFIKILDENGNYGYAEPSPYILEIAKLIPALKYIFLKHFKDKDNKKINLSKIIQKLRNPNLQKLVVCFDHAINELIAKKHNKSVAQLFLKKKKKIQLYASGGMIYEKNDYHSLIEEALEYKEKKFFGWKFRPSFPNSNLSHAQRIKNPPPFDTRKLLDFATNLRKCVGDSFNLMLDCGGRCTDIKQAHYLADALYELNFFFLEEPLKRKTSLYKKFSKKKIKLQIAGGENISNLKEFNNWKKSKLDIFQPDTNLLTFNEIKIIEKIWKKKIIFHNWCNLINFATNFNYILSSDRDIILEKNILQNPYEKCFINDSFKINNGVITKLKNCGYGIKIKKIKYKDIAYNQIKV